MSGAAQLSDDSPLDAAEAFAVDRLIKALPTQSQLESIEVVFGDAILPIQEPPRARVDSAEEAAMEAEAAKEANKLRKGCDMTAKMFLPAWMSVHTLMRNSHMFRLRYSTPKVPYLASRGVEEQIGFIIARVAWYGM